MNKPEDYRPAIVEFLEDGAHRVHYLREPFRREPDFDAAASTTPSRTSSPAPSHHADATHCRRRSTASLQADQETISSTVEHTKMVVE